MFEILSLQMIGWDEQLHTFGDYMIFKWLQNWPKSNQQIWIKKTNYKPHVVYKY